MSTVPDSRPCGALRVCARGGRGLALGLLAVLGACDYPTSSPKWYTEWLVPVKSTRLTAGQLLPATVGAVADGSAFMVAVPPVTIARSLGQLCSTCLPLAGTNVPKPAFTATVLDTLDLPVGVASAALVGGAISVAINNGLSFDPLRPSATARGSLTIVLIGRSETLGTVTVDGTDTGLPPGSTLTREVALGSGLGDGLVNGGILVSVYLASPAGDAVWIDASQGLTVTATPGGIRVTAVSVTVNQKPVSVEAADLDLSNVEQTVIDHVHGGTLVVSTDNPFQVAGPLTLTISGGGLNPPITKPLGLAAGQSTQRVDFTLDELRRMLGRAGLVVHGTGTLSAAAPVWITPSQSVGITTQLDLIVGPKEN